jgi:hypothetical protein
VARGWLDDAGHFTEVGKAARATLEEDTNRPALTPWERLGAERAERFYTLMQPLVRQIVRSGGMPMPNPMGVPVPGPDE